MLYIYGIVVEEIGKIISTFSELSAVLSFRKRLDIIIGVTCSSGSKSLLGHDGLGVVWVTLHVDRKTKLFTLTQMTPPKVANRISPEAQLLDKLVMVSFRQAEVAHCVSGKTHETYIHINATL